MQISGSQTLFRETLGFREVGLSGIPVQGYLNGDKPLLVPVFLIDTNVSDVHCREF